MLDEAAVSYQIVLTKLDKLKKAEQDKIVPGIVAKSWPNTRPPTQKSSAHHL